MNSRSYIRILNNKGSQHSNQFTTVSTPIKQQRSTRRRRLKERKKTQHAQHSTASALNGNTFDEPAISKPFKPTQILQRSPAKPSKKPLPQKRRLMKEHYKIETHTSEKQGDHTSNDRNHSNHSNAKSPPKHTNVYRSPPTQMSFSAQFIANGFTKKSNINGAPSKSEKIAMNANHLNTKHKRGIARKMNDDSRTLNGNGNRNTREKQMHKRNKMNQLMTMLDGIDTDDIFNDIVNHKRNYEFPRTVSGIYKSFIWDHTIEHDNSSWDMIFKYDQY